jgi:hypothetical protein
MPWWQQPFIQVTLPLMITFAGVALAQTVNIHRRIDDLARRVDEIIRRLERIESLLGGHSSHIWGRE